MRFLRLIIVLAQYIVCKDSQYFYNGKNYVIKGLSDNDEKFLKKVKRFIKKYSCSEIEIKKALNKEFDSVLIKVDNNNHVAISVKKPKIANKVYVKINSTHNIKRLLEQVLSNTSLRDKDKKERMFIVRSILERYNIYKYEISEKFIERSDKYEILITVKHSGEAKPRLVVNKSSSIKSNILHDCIPSTPLGFFGHKLDYSSHHLLVSNILQKLKSLGYLVAKVEIKGEIFNRKMNTRDLQIHIEEGPKCIMRARVEIDERLPVLIKHEIPKLPAMLFFAKASPFTQKSVNHIANEICMYLNERNIRYCKISIENPRIDNNMDSKADREYELIFKITIDEEAVHVKVKERSPCLTINIDSAMQGLSTLSGDLVSDGYIELNANELNDPISKQITLKDGELIYESELTESAAFCQRSVYSMKNLFMDKSQLDFIFNPFYAANFLVSKYGKMYTNLEKFSNLCAPLLHYISSTRDLTTCMNYQKQTSSVHNIRCNAFIERKNPDTLSDFFKGRSFTVDSNSVLFIPYYLLQLYFGNINLTDKSYMDTQGIKFKSEIKKNVVMNGCNLDVTQSLYMGRETHYSDNKDSNQNKDKPIDANTVTIAQNINISRNRPYDKSFDWRANLSNKLTYSKLENHKDCIEPFFDKIKGGLDIEKKWSNGRFRFNIKAGAKISPMALLYNSMNNPFHGFEASDVSEEHYYRIKSNNSGASFFYHLYIEFKMDRYLIGFGTSNIFGDKDSIFKIIPFVSLGFNFTPYLGFKINKGINCNEEVIIKNLLFTL